MDYLTKLMRLEILEECQNGGHYSQYKYYTFDFGKTRCVADKHILNKTFT